MTKRQIENRLRGFGLRLERRDPPQFVESAHGNWHARWIVRPDTIGSCMEREVTPLCSLTDAEDLIDRHEIMRRD